MAPLTMYCMQWFRVAPLHIVRCIYVAYMCCSVLQCVAVCCSVLQCVAVCCSVLQCVAVCMIVHCIYCMCEQYVQCTICNGCAMYCICSVSCTVCFGVVYARTSVCMTWLMTHTCASSRNVPTATYCNTPQHPAMHSNISIYRALYAMAPCVGYG